ncbi:response regulator [Natronorubrum sp. JWXQ-INN-674]|uniref:Response regulator n=1 Tax=Natronorubrum halalkaliphilum TaxID=2691917 RepID=A0A6B0VQW5_9EURY|nr:response regulator [Natronorubrum halalkaliphilum]MXV63898.1 response regulator [Natronorubrum halalkaliphilum]
MPRTNTDPGTSDEPVDIHLIEDNPGDVRLTRAAFDDASVSHTFHVSTDGDDALEYLLEDDGYPDLVLLDLDLPGSDGHEILERISADPQLRRLPVIVLTSSDASDDVSKCYDANANAYLTKPTDPDEFATLVEIVERFWFEQVQLPSISS